MTGSSKRRSSRALLSAAAAAVLALTACTVESADRYALEPLMGENDLLIDPALLTPRPNLTLTLHLLDAARRLGIDVEENPDPAMVSVLIGQEDELARPELALRWSLLEGDSLGTDEALTEAADLCAAKAAPGSNCAFVVAGLDTVLRASEPAKVEAFRTRVDVDQDAVCAAAGGDAWGAFDRITCGPKRPSADEISKAAEQMLPDVEQQTDSLAIWQLAAAAEANGVRPRPLVELVGRALERSTVRGILVDTTPLHGTVLTTWAVLHLAGDDGADLPRLPVEKAVRKEDSAAPDRALVVNASLAQLGVEERPTIQPVVLADPDGPYNPFLALAARDVDALDQVTLAFGFAEARRSPESLASYLITRWVLTGARVTTPARDLRTLTNTLNDGQTVPRVQLLLATALRAAGRDAEAGTALGTGCEGFDWLVEDDGVCDLRGSLLRVIYEELGRDRL